MQKIIAIQGYKNVGKDTVAEMLQYLLSTPSIMHNYTIYKILRTNLKFTKNFKIVRYADKMKKMLSHLLNVNIADFEDRNFKEHCYIDFTNLSKYFIDNVNTSPYKDKILSDSKFSKEIKKPNSNITKDYFLSIRQILQYFGTEIMRYYFGDKLWVLSTLSTKHRNIIISDQRFTIENKITSSLGATIIHVTRPSCERGSHSSESELEALYNSKSYTYLIENNGTLKELFNNCKNIVRNGLFS